MGRRGLHADQPLKVVALGGGTGLAALLRALKPEAGRPLHPWRLTGIVAVSDNGGSSGRLRAELGGLPPGDLRNCLAALTLESSVLSDLLEYRFKGEGALAGHALGNLMLLALVDLVGDWSKAVRQLGTILVTVGRLYPSTSVPMNLHAEDWEGRRYDGEVEVNQSRPPLARLWLEPRGPEPLPEAILAILQADLIILAPGSLYTSTLPNLLLPELREAVVRSAAPRIYVANLMTEAGESDGLNLEDHVASVQAFGGLSLDAVVANNQPPGEDLLRRYEAEGGAPLLATEPFLCGVPVHPAPLLDPGSRQARHEAGRLNRAIRGVIEAL